MNLENAINSTKGRIQKFKEAVRIYYSAVFPEEHYDYKSYPQAIISLFNPELGLKYHKKYERLWESAKHLEIEDKK